MFRRVAAALPLAALAAARRGRGAATTSDEAKPARIVELFTPAVGVMASIISGAAIVGYAMAEVGKRNDATVAALAARLEEKVAGLEKLLDEKEKSLGKEMGGVKDTVTKQMEGVPDKAKAAALEVLKDYRVAVEGGLASK